MSAATVGVEMSATRAHQVYVHTKTRVRECTSTNHRRDRTCASIPTISQCTHSAYAAEPTKRQCGLSCKVHSCLNSTVLRKQLFGHYSCMVMSMQPYSEHESGCSLQHIPDSRLCCHGQAATACSVRHSPNSNSADEARLSRTVPRTPK
jgi:hypothetical protein